MLTKNNKESYNDSRKAYMRDLMRKKRANKNVVANTIANKTANKKEEIANKTEKSVSKSVSTVLAHKSLPQKDQEGGAFGQYLRDNKITKRRTQPFDVDFYQFLATT